MKGWDQFNLKYWLESLTGKQVVIDNDANIAALGEAVDYLRGFTYAGSASRQGWSRVKAELNIGGEFKDALAEPGPWKTGLGYWRNTSLLRKQNNFGYKKD